jgi:hypothetical protein
MGIVRKEDIQGYRVCHEVLCNDCISEDECDGVREEDILIGEMRITRSSSAIGARYEFLDRSL